MLSGLAAGRKSVQYLLCGSRKSAMATAKELRTDKVLETGLTGELYRARKVKVVSFDKAYPVDYLRKVYAKTLAKG
jgi:hypothetical protein